MQINKLILNNFRNFEKYTLKPEKVNLLLGPNGVGKTNLIEAIYLLSVCRSYRTRKDAEIIKWNLHPNSPEKGSPPQSVVPPEAGKSSPEIEAKGSLRQGRDDKGDHTNSTPLLAKEGISGSDTSRVAVEATSDKGDNINIAVAQTGEKKVAFIGDKSVPVSLLVGSLPTVIFTPESMDLPEAPPTKRRRTLDVLLAQIDPKYTQTLLRYNQIIKARNKLLDGISKGRNKENELDFWDKQLIDLGAKILSTRLKITKELNNSVGKSYEKIAQGIHTTPSPSSPRRGAESSFTHARGETILHQDYGRQAQRGGRETSNRKLSFEYLSTIENIDRFEEELVAAREQELRYGNTVIGPHRDDWQMKFDGVDIRMSASRGETRAALLALKMAEMDILCHKRDELPILLLDDVFAELDKRHSESLLEFFGSDTNSLSEATAESKGYGKGYNKESLRCASTLTQTVKSSPQIFITATDAEYIPESIKKKAKVIKLSQNPNLKPQNDNVE